MTPEWLEDRRKVPDDVMYYIRRMAVYAVRVLGQSPEKVAEAYNFDRSCIYRWLKQYDGGGFEALESHMPRGSDPIITKAADDWMKQAVLDSTPVDFGYDTNLWVSPILVALLQDKFGVTERHGGEAAPEGDGADLPETRIPGRGKGRRGNRSIL